MCKKYFSDQNFWKKRKIDQIFFSFAPFYFQTKHSEKHKITGKSRLFPLKRGLPQDCLNTLVPRTHSGHHKSMTSYNYDVDKCRLHAVIVVYQHGEQPEENRNNELRCVSGNDEADDKLHIVIILKPELTFPVSSLSNPSYRSETSWFRTKARKASCKYQAY